MAGSDWTELQPASPSPSAEDSAEQAAAEQRLEKILQAALAKCDKKEHGLLQLCSDIVAGTYVEDLQRILETTKCNYKSLERFLKS